MNIQEVIDRLEALKKEYGPDISVCLQHPGYPETDIKIIWAFEADGFRTMIYIE